MEAKPMIVKPGDEVIMQVRLSEYTPICAYVEKVQELIRCRDCKHFEYNHWEKVNRVPLIVAHEICTKWGDGCKTSEDGYCFMAERKEVEDDS